MERDPADVVDQQTGTVRVLAHPCTTCIFRADDPMSLGPQYTERVVDQNLEANALLTCHQTLSYGDHPDFGPAVCAGFWKRHRNDVTAGRIAQIFLGITEILPPKGNRKTRT